MGNRTSSALSQDQYEANRAKLPCGKEFNDGSKTAKLAEKFLHAYNMRDWKTLNAFVATENTSFSFKGADASVPLDMWVSQLDELLASFPDAVLTWDKIEETEPGVALISNVYSRGTHTGVPFAYANLPPIPVTGKVVTEGPTQITYMFKNGKLHHVQFELAPGDLSGPAGFYTKIGGKLF